MRRFQDWPTRMDAWMRAHAQDAHAYGSWDCALMAASHIDNLTGSQLFAQHAYQYEHEAAAAHYLITLGAGGLEGLATMVLGQPLPSPKFAQRGDVVTFDTDIGTALGIVDLTGLRIAALNPSKTGFIRLPLALATAAWRV
ncbi:MAG: hypothetical protein ACAH80_18595 [Alphaproteobacteria bacterium]